MSEMVHAAVAFLGAHSELLVGTGALVASFVLGAAGVGYLIVRLPEDYFDRPERPLLSSDRPEWMQVMVKVGKNVLGAATLVGGGAIVLTGHPVVGALAILIGVKLLDIPGKARLQRRILCEFKVLTLMNRPRARHGRPPFRISAAPAGCGS
jgi:hypothetical protein